MTSLAALPAVVLPSFARPAFAQGAGPVWPQFQGGAGHPGALSDGVEPPYRVRWTFPAPEGSGLSGAVIVDGLAIAVGEAAVYGIDLETGERAWEVERAGGPLSVPAVVPGAGRAPDLLLYLEGPDDASDDAPASSGTVSPSPGGSPSPTASGSPTSDEPVPAGSDLVAIDLSDRSERWRVGLGATSRTGVTVDADTAYVGDQDGTITSVAVGDGTVRWTAEAGSAVDVPLAVGDGGVIAVARSIEDRTVSVDAYALDDGELLWRVSPQIGSSVASAPASDGGVLVVGLADRLVRALGDADGEQRWAALTVSLYSPATSPALHEGAVYIADIGGGLYRLDPEDGGRAWSHQLNEVVLRSSPVVSGEAVLVGLNDGRLVAVDASSGHLVWQSDTSRGLIGTIALSRDEVVAVKGGPEAGLIAFEHDPDGVPVDVPSPAELDAGTTLTRVGIAAAIVLVVVLVPGMLSRRRFGGPFPDEVEDEAEAEEVEV